MPKADLIVYPNTMARTAGIQGIPVREDVLFADAKGTESPRIRRQNEKLIQKLAPALARVLVADEAVLYITRAQSQLSVVEQFTASVWTMMMAACAIVVTNRRLLVFPVKANGTWRESARSVLWGDLAGIDVSGMLTKTLKLKFQNGQKENYLRITRNTGTILQAIAAVMMPSAAGEQSQYGGMVNICPDCRAVLTPKVYTCHSCGLVFKNEKTMRLLAIFVPGGGYFYIGYPVLGVLLCLVEGFVLLGMIGQLMLGHPGEFLQIVAVFAGIWAVETAVNILHSQRLVRQFLPYHRNPMRTAAFAANAGPGQPRF